jgi:hypothetical protein
VSVRALIDEDRRLTVRQVEYLMHTEMCVDISRSTVHTIMREELALRKVWFRQFFRKLDESFYFRGIRKLIDRYEKCLNNECDYVEK